MTEGYDPSREPPSFSELFWDSVPLAFYETSEPQWFAAFHGLVGAAGVAIILGLMGALKGVHFLAGWLLCAFVSFCIHFVWMTGVAANRALNTGQSFQLMRADWLEKQRVREANRPFLEATARRIRGEAVLADLMGEVARRREAPIIAARQRAERQAALEQWVANAFDAFRLRNDWDGTADQSKLRTAFRRQLAADTTLSAADRALLIDSDKIEVKKFFLPMGGW